MAEARNRQQAVADEVVRTVKERRRIVEIASRGLSEPGTLTSEDVRSICEFVAVHAESMPLSFRGE